MKINRIFHSKARVFFMGSLSVVIIFIFIVIAIYLAELNAAAKVFRREALSDVQLVYSVLDTEAAKKMYKTMGKDKISRDKVVNWMDLVIKNNQTISLAYVYGLKPEYTKNNQIINLGFPTKLNSEIEIGSVSKQSLVFMNTLHEVLKTKKSATTILYIDKFGVWVTALVPIIGEDGNIDMVLGIDKDASNLRKGKNYFKISVVVINLIFLFILAYTVSTLKMINSNKYLNQKIKESNDALEAQLQYVMENEKMIALGNLVAGVAHEINTPLGVAITSVTYMDSINKIYKEKFDNATMTKADLVQMIEKVNESTGIIIKNLNNAANLINSFKRIAVDQSLNSKTTFSLKDLLESVVLSLKHEYKYLKIQILIECPIDLMVHTDPGAIVQIVTNLIMNGIKHGKDPSKDLTIKLSVQEKDKGVILSYYDDGKGIDPVHLPHIFEPFYTTNRAKGGSGLGLNIVYNLVTQTLQGTIRAASTFGVETKFVLEFPQNLEVSS